LSIARVNVSKPVASVSLPDHPHRHDHDSLEGVMNSGLAELEAAFEGCGYTFGCFPEAEVFSQDFQPRQGVVASSLKLFRNGAVGS